MSEANATRQEPSRRQFALAIAGSLMVALVVLVTAVLPAEYGIDPLGTGRALGLDQLAATGAATDMATLQPLEAVRPGANTAQPAVFKRDTKEFELGPFESMEYKYRVEQKGAAFVYGWTSSAPVNVDFHGEPDGAPKGTAEFYEQTKGTAAAQGTFYAPSPGIHGWYWENQGADVVTVKLTSAGFYSYAIEFRQHGETHHLIK
jgi:hypothetical protein